MTQAKVKITVRRPTNKTSVLDIKGDINALAEDKLMDAYTRATGQGAKAIILNFGELEYMNSSGIGLLVTLLIRANRQGQQLLAVGLSDHYQHIFELTRLNEAIRTYESEAAAIGSLKS